MSEDVKKSEVTLCNKENGRRRLEPSGGMDWTFIDIIVVFGICMFAPTIIGVILRYALASSTAIIRFMEYAGSLWHIFVPLWWIRWKYGLTRVALGMRETQNSFTVGLLGVLIASVYTILLYCTLLRPEIPGAGPTVTRFDLLMLPLSIDGFLFIVLGPVGEEILFRGFIYPYLRKKMGVMAGQILQAVIFSLVHSPFDPPDSLSYQLLLFSFRFVAGLIFGILYQRTQSLYPSMVSHGAMNYVELILPFLIARNG